MLEARTANVRVLRIDGRAWEAENSRCWAGIHYGIDDDAGLKMGRQIGRLIASLARADEAATTA